MENVSFTTAVLQSCDFRASSPGARFLYYRQAVPTNYKVWWSKSKGASSQKLPKTEGHLRKQSLLLRSTVSLNILVYISKRIHTHTPTRSWWSKSKGASLSLSLSPIPKRSRCVIQNQQPTTTKHDLNSRYLNSLLGNVRLMRFFRPEQGDHSCRQAYTEQEAPSKPDLQIQRTPNNKNCCAGREFFY